MPRIRHTPRARSIGLVSTTIASIGIFAAACGGGAANSAAQSQAKPASDTAQFCQDYAAAAESYQETTGDVADPAFKDFLTQLGKAKSEAPAAIASPVARMYNLAQQVQHSNGSIDLTSLSTTVSNWADSNCNLGGSSPTPSSSGAASVAPSVAAEAPRPAPRKRQPSAPTCGM